jgi:hypothetical protein
LVLPREKIQYARKLVSITFFGILTLSSLWVMLATKFKLERTMQFLIYGYVLLFGARLIQSISDSFDERAVSYWDTVIEMIFEICWAFMYFFISQMVIVKTLLLDPAAINTNESVSNIMKSNQSKGERIRN